jgi:predicted TIM-barrel fold metal-dependent hydrolase
VAERVFNMMNQMPDSTFSFDTVKPFQDYVMHRIIRLARKYSLPMQFHTGLQAGDGNYIQNSNPALLVNLFLEYRDVTFIIFHGGYPYGGEFGSLAKNFRNVFIDLCWLYIISPSYSERYLHEWIETVPANKIMAFGGDFENVENIFGHSLMARDVVAKVLIDKVRTGYLTEEEALYIAHRILYQNAIDVFKLE